MRRENDGYFLFAKEGLEDKIRGVDLHVKPPVGYYSYANPASQGSLLRATSKWPLLSKLKSGQASSSSYSDRLQSWNRDLWAKAIRKFSSRKGSLTYAIQSSTEESLIAMARVLYPKWFIVAVRWVFYYNVATGYPCERLDIVYTLEKPAKKEKKKCKSQSKSRSTAAVD